jgi:hypothetical protein
MLDRKLSDRGVHTLLLPSRKSFFDFLNAPGIVHILSQEVAASLVPIHRLSKKLFPHECNEKVHRGCATPFDVAADLPLFKPISQVPFKRLLTESPQVFESQVLDPSSFVADLGAQLVVLPGGLHNVFVDPVNLEKLAFGLTVRSAVSQAVETHPQLRVIKLDQKAFDVLLKLNSAHHSVSSPQHQDLNQASAHQVDCKSLNGTGFLIQNLGFPHLGKVYPEVVDGWFNRHELFLAFVYVSFFCRHSQDAKTVLEGRFLNLSAVNIAERQHLRSILAPPSGNFKIFEGSELATTLSQTSL